MTPLMWQSKCKHNAKRKLANVFDGSYMSDSSEYEESDYEDEFTGGSEDDMNHNENGDNDDDIQHNENGDNDDDFNMAVPESLKCEDYVKSRF